MRLSELTLIFLIVHLLCDYHLQSQQLADGKAERFSAVLAHAAILCAISGLAAGALALWSGRWEPLVLAALLCGLHLLIDALKYALTRRWTRKGLLDDRAQQSGETPGQASLRKNRAIRRQTALYLADQAVHLAVIALAIEWVYLRVLALPPVDTGRRDILQCVLLAALITKPANVSFKILFAKYQLSAADTPAGTEPGAGALIGSLERIITAVFIYLGQYGAIGLIYTAKSIARFKQIEENPRFAEYYLIGTLYSILYVVSAYHIVHALSF